MCPGGRALGAGRGSETMRVAALKSEDSLCTWSLRLWAGMLPAAHCARSALAPEEACPALPEPTSCCQDRCFALSRRPLFVSLPAGGLAVLVLVSRQMMHWQMMHWQMMH